METLQKLIIDSFIYKSDAIAVKTKKEEFSFNQYNDFILKTNLSFSDDKKVFIFTYKDIFAYSSVIACALQGKTFVPLNSTFPEQRLAKIINAVSSKTIILTKDSIEAFNNFKFDFSDFTVLCVGFDKDLVSQKCNLISFDSLTPLKLDEIELCDESVGAYNLFTSGTTGEPKGIEISHKNAYYYFKNNLEFYKFNPQDRLSQTFDISFDLFMHDIFMSFLSKAGLYVFDKMELMMPLKFIKDNKINVFFCVPSLAMNMQKLRLLKENSLDFIDMVIFCGEALPLSVLDEFIKAAPNAKFINIYGPTEATIAITRYIYEPKDREFFKNNIVPIGHIYKDNEYKIFDNELLLSGGQVITSYLNKDLKKPFLELDGKIWYKTGDLVEENECGLIYLGRSDDQVKINGFRIELLEVEGVLKKVANTPLAVCVVVDDKIYAFVEKVVEDENEEKNRIINECLKVLPHYMKISKVFFLDKLPLNVNSKIDKKELYARYKDS